MLNNEMNILNSWEANAENWINTIEKNEIESRKLVTNQAIIESILREKPQNAIDIGCGEGWLTHKLAEKGIQMLGVDGIPKLIEYAKNKPSTAAFTIATYQEIVQKKLGEQTFDMAIINFALIGKESTDELINFLPTLLSEHGKIVIQTLHPFAIAKEKNYQSAWVEGSWAGLSNDFVMPYHWYFRTFSDWIKLFRESHLQIVSIEEPLNPKTMQAVSVIFVLKKGE
jgi:2-polyprenyl-3-methyl-5-hydroxy-6-metoxy-1,4-benzoquinol methylase